ncbi:MAG TPA: hypothetical protein EYQ69_03905 [Gemmatimonadetes bacterium]|nr:hypothetical protein [Gemmatimonadota bacterium]
MKNYTTAKHVLNAIAIYEPDALILEVEAITRCIQKGKKCDTFPKLSRKELARLLEEFLDEADEGLLIERTLTRILHEENVRSFIRNVLSS